MGLCFDGPTFLQIIFLYLHQSTSVLMNGFRKNVWIFPRLSYPKKMLRLLRKNLNHQRWPMVLALQAQMCVFIFSYTAIIDAK